jgi:hypothetical protein
VAAVLDRRLHQLGDTIRRRHDRFKHRRYPYRGAVRRQWLASLGFELPPDLAEVIFAGFFGLVVFAVNELGGRYDWVNRLFSLGLSPSAATYAKP